MNQRPRVGLFQAKWPLQVHTTNAIKVLVPQGYDVDIFIYEVSQDFDNLRDFDKNVLEHLSVIDFSQTNNTISKQPKVNLKRILKEKLHSYPRFYKLIINTNRTQKKLVGKINDFFYFNHLSILPQSLLDRTRKYMEGRTYKCLIGIERYGLIWAGIMAQKNKIPLVYWSLNLFTTSEFSWKDFPWLFKDPKDFESL
jgi:hypothetical protein